MAPDTKRSVRLSRGATWNWLAARCSELSVWHDIRAVPPLAIWAGVNCVALMLLVRHVVAPASLKLSATQLEITATVAGILAIVARALLARVERRLPAGWLRAAATISAACPILTLLLGTSRAVPAATIGYVWGIAAFSAGVAWVASRALFERLMASLVAPESVPLKARSSTREPAIQQSRATLCQSAPSSVPIAAQRNEARRHEVASMNLRLERLCDPAAGERLQGTVVAEFVSGQSLSTVHVAFHPPFARAPEVSCEVANRSATRIKAVTVYPYGARLELKRSGILTASICVEIRFRATLSAHAARAA
ncbi:MAG: hypothetical protein EXS05_19830 [Planctomycetaceae bacterium]|nr:hypothetical protein [Planctomycetaceae bacterium]